MTTEFKYIGTLIERTLRSEDLIPAFHGLLEELNPGNKKLNGINEFKKFINDDEIPEEHLDNAIEYVSELIEELNYLSPAHVYFGSVEGDGSDYGYWPELEFDNCDITVTKTPSPLIHDTEFIDNDCQVIVQQNDHGNVTVTDMKRNVIWAIV
jgi:hypothetical protein|tara:strand:+ start:1037 stop:1495 length:459 start_codon:yes stop_codon:yes gene_type:complete